MNKCTFLRSNVTCDSKSIEKVRQQTCFKVFKNKTELLAWKKLEHWKKPDKNLCLKRMEVEK